MSEYEGRLRLFHQDLYRLAGTDEALAGGLLDERQDDGVTLSEWADRLDDELDPSRLSVTIEPAGEDRRHIELRGHGDIARRYVGAARRWQGLSA
jgi:tRNA threonylcarbamoyladenosine biosynthesis protein TsaE